jgi:nitroreductase
MTMPTDPQTSLHPLIADRWSPRSFDAAAEIRPAELNAMLEAARWAPSAMNRQPWRFVVGLRGEEAFTAIHGSLAPGNQVWADRAGALVAAFAESETDEGIPVPGTPYEVGLAVAQLTVQAHAEDLHVHQMAGFGAAQLTEAVGAPPTYQPVVVLAIGRLAPAEQLPDALRAREVAPRTRRPLGEIAFAGRWGQPAEAAAELSSQETRAA